MKKRAEKLDRRLKLAERILKRLKFSWVRFDEPFPHFEKEDKEEGLTHWYRLF